jgi:hypothetical protein
MKKPKRFYFEKEDVLHLVMSDEEEANSMELSPNITAELSDFPNTDESLDQCSIRYNCACLVTAMSGRYASGKEGLARLAFSECYYCSCIEAALSTLHLYSRDRDL